MDCAVCLSQTCAVEQWVRELWQWVQNLHLELQCLHQKVEHLQNEVVALRKTQERSDSIVPTSPAASHESYEVDQLMIDRDQLNILVHQLKNELGQLQNEMVALRKKQEERDRSEPPSVPEGLTPTG